MARLPRPAHPGIKRDRLFKKVTDVTPFFAEYQTQTDRVIPEVVLNRAA